MRGTFLSQLPARGQTGSLLCCEERVWTVHVNVNLKSDGQNQCGSNTAVLLWVGTPGEPREALWGPADASPALFLGLSITEGRYRAGTCFTVLASDLLLQREINVAFKISFIWSWGFPSGSVVKNLPAMQAIQEKWVWSPGQEDPLREGNGNWLQYSCLENPMDGGA